MKKVNSELFLATKEPAFCIVGDSAEYDEPGAREDTPVRTTAYIIRANDAFCDRYEELADTLFEARTANERDAYEELAEFRRDVCGKTCSKDATLWHIGFNTFAVTWRRVVIK